jgi:MFS family permease
MPSDTLAPFRYPVYRAIWIAMLFSWFGTLIQSVGAAWQMVSLTKSHQLIALIQASNTLPITLFALFAGAIADSYDRRRVMLFAQVGMLTASVLLALFSWRGVITPTLLLSMTLATGIGTALNGPAWQASLRLQVPAKVLPQAVSLNGISFNLARSVGPAIGGLLISISGPALNYAVNALSYVGIIIVLWRWKPGEIAPKREPLLPAIARGFAFCRSDKAIYGTVFRSMMFGLTATCLQALTPLIAKELLHGDQLSYGLLLGSFGIGSIVMAVGITQMRAHIGNDWTVTFSTLIYASGTALAGCSTSLTTALPALFLCGAGWVGALTSLNIVVQMRAPDEIAGRCISIYHMFTFGGAALGAWLWGALSGATSVKAALIAGAVAQALTVLLTLIARVPEVGSRA